MRYVDPTGKWTLNIGFGAGLAAKFKLGHNDNKWEFEWRIGWGAGGEFSYDAQDESFTDGETKVGVYVEAEISAESNDFNLSADAQVGIQTVVDDEQTSVEIDLPNNASFELQGPDGVKTGITLDKGSITPSEPKPDSELFNFGGKGMFFAGFGGSGVLKEDE